MLYVSLPFLKGHLPFLKGHTLIPKAKIRLSFGLPKVSLVFWGRFPVRPGMTWGRFRVKPGMRNRRVRNEDGSRAPKWRPLVAGCEQKPLISCATEALGLVAVALSTAGGTKMARNVPRDVLEHGWGNKNGLKRALWRAVLRDSRSSRE